MRTNTLIVHAIYFINDAIRREIAALQSTGRPLLITARHPLPHPANTAFFLRDASALPYMPPDGPPWYNSDSIAPLVRQALPSFDYYLLVEYDVRYGGCWGDLLDKLDRFDDDMLSAQLVPWRDEPDWSHWNEGPTGIAKENLWKVFPPLTRFSGRAIDYVDSQHRAGRGGFCEVAWPTLLKEGGFSVRDLRDCGIECGADAFTWFAPGESVSVDASRKNCLFHSVR